MRDLVPAIRDARFDLVWLLPPSYAGDSSGGYNPKKYFRLDNSYGTLDQHRAMSEALLRHGIEPVADIHRKSADPWRGARSRSAVLKTMRTVWEEIRLRRLSVYQQEA